jgi:tetratricopeptide (TPR) repeat protein
MRRVNLKCFLGLLGVLVGVTAGLALAHHLQTGRIARALRSQAQTAEEQGRLERADHYLSRYLEFVPADIEARAHLGHLLARRDMTVTRRGISRAIMVLEQVLGRDPDRHDCRLLLVRVALDVGHFELAGEHLNILANASPTDPEAAELRGRLHEMRDQYAEAMACYRRARQANPNLIESHIRLADLLRRYLVPGRDKEEQYAEADRVMDELVASNASSSRAYLARWYYRKKTFTDPKKESRQLQDAAQDVVRAQQLAPDEPDVLVAVAEASALGGNGPAARKILEDGLARHPEEAVLYRALATLELKNDRRSSALDVLRLAVQKLPRHHHYEFLWTLTNLLLDSDPKGLTEAETHLAELRKGLASAAATDYLQGRIFVVQGRWIEAARLLERVRPALEGTPELGPQVEVMLGQCYARLNDTARQADACARLVRQCPDSVPAHLALAEAEAARGHLDPAIQEYRKVLTLPGGPLEARLEIIRLLIRRNFLSNQQDWSAVNAALDEAEKALSRAGEPPAVSRRDQTAGLSGELCLLRAQALVAQNKLKEAENILAAARRQDPECKQPRLHLALALLRDQQGQTDEARRLLDEVERLTGNTARAELCVARIRFWSRRRGHEVPAALAQLAQGLDQLKPAEQTRVLQALAEAHSQQENWKDSENLWIRLADQPGKENDARLRMLLCELAMRTQNESLMQRAVDDLRRIEGGQGPMWCYAEALHLISRFQRRQAQPQDLVRARTLLDEAVSKQPVWSSSAVLAQGELAEMQGKHEQAIRYYRQARHLGERSPRLRRHLVELLYKQQRYREAQEEITQLFKEGHGSASLQVLAADLSLHTQDSLQAVQMAVQALPADSKDYRHHLWLGQVLAGSQKMPEEAERHLRKAVQLGEKYPETWVALVSYLASRERTAEVEALLSQARDRLPSQCVPLALASCYEAVNRMDLAHKQYEAALSARPDDAVVLRNSANFYLRTLRSRLAEPLLRRLVERQVPAAEEDVAWARNGLAVALAARGDHASFLEALKHVGLDLDGSGQVIEDPQQPGEDTIERQRARARVLASRTSRTFRALAITWLEELDRKEGLAAGDRFLLSQLYQATDAWVRAGDTLRRLVQDHGQEPIYLAQLTLNLLHQGKTDEAQKMLVRLEEMEKNRKYQPGALGTVELRARVLEETGEGNQAVALLQTQARRQGARPEDVLLPINSLARQKRFREALDLCEQAWQTCPAEAMAGLHVGLLRLARFPAESCVGAERRLQAALLQKPRSLVLLLALADLEDLRGRFDDSEALYRRVLAVEPRQVQALNNLAWLMAQRGRPGQEALPLIKRAIDLLGPRADLLDTRALVYLALEQSDRARADLEASIGDSPTATRYLHLARAHQLAKDTDAAAAALQKARALGLKRKLLHPVEQLASVRLLESIE